MVTNLSAGTSFSPARWRLDTLTLVLQPEANGPTDLLRNGDALTVPDALQRGDDLRVQIEVHEFSRHVSMYTYIGPACRVRIWRYAVHVVILEWENGVRATIENGSIVSAVPEETIELLRGVMDRFDYSPAMGDPEPAAADHLLDFLPGGHVVYADPPEELSDGVQSEGSAASQRRNRAPLRAC
jgi:hypothetical protein